MISGNKVIYFWPNLVGADWTRRLENDHSGVAGAEAHDGSSTAGLPGRVTNSREVASRKIIRGAS